MFSRNNFSISVCFALFSFQGTPEFAKGKLGEIFLDSLRSSFRFAKPENSRPAPLNFPLCCQSPSLLHLSVLVGLSGLEPPTSRLSGVRSNRLSYKPISWFERWFPTLPGPAVSYPSVGPPAFFFRRVPFPNCPPQVWWR